MSQPPPSNSADPTIEKPQTPTSSESNQPITDSPKAGISNSPNSNSSSAIQTDSPTPTSTYSFSERPRPQSATFQRVVLPTAAIIIAIGFISFIIQYMPNWRTASPKKNKPNTKAPIVFEEQNGAYIFAIWGPTEDDRKYILECEKGETYAYEFMFHNTSDKDVEFGVDNMLCGCSGLKLSVVPKDQAVAYFRERQNNAAWVSLPQDSFEWTELKKDWKKGVVVPAGMSGLVRLHWDARGDIGSNPKLRADVWARFHNDSDLSRFRMGLIAKAEIVDPVRFYPSQIKLGFITSNETLTKKVYCLTSTRDSLDVKIDKEKAGLDPCIECKITPIDPEQFPKLSKTITGVEWKTKIRAAYQIELMVAETKTRKLPSGKMTTDQLTMGRVHKKLPLMVRAGGVVENSTIPFLNGWVDSEIQIQTPESQSGSKVTQQSINLGSYSSVMPITKKYKLFADPEVTLKLLRTEASFVTSELGDPIVKEQSKFWWLTIQTQKNSPTGALRNTAAIVLRREHPSRPARDIRIPISGTVLE
ncbi:MAG: hypothetical protein ACFCD0_14845 [Gemmataceae bacterium]